MTAAVSNLLSITLAPTAATRSVGESQNFTATGHYEGGAPQNLTQQVAYAASAPGVVAAPNSAGNRGRVEMVAPGTATISATYTDPATGAAHDATIDIADLTDLYTFSVDVANDPRP